MKKFFFGGCFCLFCLGFFFFLFSFFFPVGFVFVFGVGCRVGGFFLLCPVF